jgi:hypothetical protein
VPPRAAPLLLLLAACGLTPPVGTTPGHAAPGVFADLPCAAPPATGPRRRFHHHRSRAIAWLAPRHRGVDLIATPDGPQRLLVELRYGVILDKALEGEDVEVFACRAGAWHPLATATTGHDGRVALLLDGADRLPLGLHDLYASVVGDRSGARFLALVAPPHTPLVVSDLDGTLTTAENAFPTALLTGAAVDAHPGAAAALVRLVARGLQPIYVSARGRRFTAATRAWLDAQGLPRGPVRLPPAILTLPGDETVAMKSAILADLAATGLTITLGLGNRASDIAAYTQVHLAPRQILIKRPEFDAELGPHLAAHEATPFDDYRTLDPSSP